MDIVEFQEIIWQKGRELYRTMPWREDTRPYYVLVSELMLQQTQVDRVVLKFTAFIARFPDVLALAEASLADVVVLWQGLGYNRRAKYLHDAAKKIIDEYNGVFPDTVATLHSLPGVGPNTAGAIMAYAYNQPVVFVETNIRSVYFHHFFNGDTEVTDKQIIELLEHTIDHEHPREFYWALMDYGVYLKRNGAGSINQSKHYKKQSPLVGSVREVRGRIIKQLADGDRWEKDLKREILADERYQSALDGLIRDGLVMRAETGKLHLSK